MGTNNREKIYVHRECAERRQIIVQAAVRSLRISDCSCSDYDLHGEDTEMKENLLTPKKCTLVKDKEATYELPSPPFVSVLLLQCFLCLWKCSSVLLTPVSEFTTR